MPNARSQARNNNEIPKRIASWDDAIDDAKKRLKEIEFALEIFEQRKKKGEPWPGEDKQNAATN